MSCCSKSKKCILIVLRVIAFILSLVFLGLIVFHLIGYNFKKTSKDVVCPKPADMKVRGGFVVNNKSFAVPEFPKFLGHANIHVKWDGDMWFGLITKAEKIENNLKDTPLENDEIVPDSLSFAAGGPTSKNSLNWKVTSGTFYFAAGANKGGGCSDDGKIDLHFTATFKLSTPTLAILACLFVLFTVFVFWPCFVKCRRNKIKHTSKPLNPRLSMTPIGKPSSFV